jgi:hypothetical protein
MLLLKGKITEALVNMRFDMLIALSYVEGNSGGGRLARLRRDSPAHNCLKSPG